MSALSALKNLIDSGQQSVAMLVLGDSTSNDEVVDEEWVYLFAQFISNKYPRTSVTYKIDKDTGGYDTTFTRAGEGSQTFTIWNASGGGWDTDVFLNSAAHNDLISDPTDTIDFVVVSLGHNEDDPLGTRWDDLFDVIESDHPTATIVVSTQNPGTAAQQTRQPLIVAEARSREFDVIYVYDEFVALGDYSALMEDATHPNAAGQQFWSEYLSKLWVGEDMVEINNVAEGLWLASDYSGTGAWLDSSGNGHNATNAGSTWVPYSSTDTGLYIPVASTAVNMLEYAGQFAALDGQDLDLRARVAIDDYASYQSTMWNNVGGFYGLSMFLNSFGHFGFNWANGSSAVTKYALSAVAEMGVSDGEFVSLRVTFEEDTGGGEYAVKFYYRFDDSEEWVQLSTTQTGTSHAYANPAANSFRFGNSAASSASNPLGGIFQYGEIYAGVDGTLVTRIEPSLSSIYKSGNTVTDSVSGVSYNIRTIPYVQPSGKPLSFVDRAQFLRGVDDYHEVADDAGLDFAADESFTLMRWGRWTDATPSADLVLLSKKDDLTTSAGYVLYVDTTGVPTFVVGDGSGAATAAGPALADGVDATITAVRDASNNSITVYTNGVPGASVEDTTTGSLANALPLRFGATSGTAANFENGADFGNAIWRSALTYGQVVVMNSRIKGLESQIEKQHGDALFIWINGNETITSGELVGALNELNGTEGKGYAEARGTYLGVAPTG